MKRNSYLPDQHQSFWQMASIQIAAFGVPSLIFGALLGKQYGAGTALISIGVGNLALWLIGLAIISMTVAERKNAINNLDGYIGKYGRLLGGLTLSLSFLFWYTIEIKSTVSAMKSVINPYWGLSESFEIRIGTFLGLITALLCMGGIKLIKWFSIASLPFFILFIIYSIIKNQSYPVLMGTWGISPNAVFAAASLALATTVNLPTFFRHRNSTTDAYLALSLFILFTTLIECLAVFLIDNQTNSMFYNFLNHNILNGVITSFFMILVLICANMSNIYFASAAWEAIFPWANKSKELAIIGMAGTLSFTVLQSQEIMSYLENIFTGFIGILGIIVISVYCSNLIIQHRIRIYELFLNFTSWVIGCLVMIWLQNIQSSYNDKAFFSGIFASVLFFIVILFAEELLWMTNNIYCMHKRK